MRRQTNHFIIKSMTSIICFFHTQVSHYSEWHTRRYGEKQFLIAKGGNPGWVTPAWFREKSVIASFIQQEENYSILTSSL